MTEIIEAAGKSAGEEIASSDEASDEATGGRIKRYLPIAVIALAAGTVYLSGAHRYLSLDALRQNYESLTQLVEARFWTSLAIFALIYIAAVALSLPGASLMTITGGFLFGTATGVATVVVAATIGATIIFLAARTAFGDVLRRQAGGVVARMEAGLKENAFSYLLLLRVIPIFPFFLVNVAPAFLNVPLRAFVLSTFIGIIPGTFAYVSVGNGLGAILETGGEVNLSGLLLQPEVLTPIIALALLGALPIALRAFGVKLDRGGKGDAADRAEESAA